MNENIILIPTFLSIGDTISLIGMIYFLLNYYKKVYLYNNYITNDYITYDYITYDYITYFF